MLCVPDMTSSLLLATQLLCCVSSAKLFYIDSGWTECSLSCGGGVQRRLNDSSITRACNTIGCPGDAGCLSAYLSFEHVANKSIYDNSHNGNLGTMHGTAKIVQGGKFGKALHLTQNGSVTFDVKNFHNRPTDAITLALWLKLTDVKKPHEIFFTCGTPQMYRIGDYHIAIANGKVGWFEKNPKGDKLFNIESEAILKSNEWIHIAGTHRASIGRARLYINGHLTKEVNITEPSKRGGEILGTKPLLNQWKCAQLGSPVKEAPIEAVMDEFYVLKCELLKEEIQDLYTKNSVKRFTISKPQHNQSLEYLTHAN